jgi:hypothetical protein
MLVPKNLIFSQIRSNTKNAALTSTLIPSVVVIFHIAILLPSVSDFNAFFYRLRIQKLRYHPGVQREKEQEADKQLALQ